MPYDKNGIRRLLAMGIHQREWPAKQAYLGLVSDTA